MVGRLVKANIGELEEKVRAGCLRRMRNDLTGVFQGIFGKKRLLARFQDGCEKDLTLNQLTIMIVEKILAEKEPDVPKNPDIPEEQITLEKGYYHGVYVILHFNKEVGVDRK